MTVGHHPGPARRLSALLASLLLILPALLVAGGGVARAGGDARAGNLYPAACYLLFVSGATGDVSHGHDVIKLEMLDGCSESSCWQPYVEAEGGHFCAYGRGAALALGREGSPKAARRFVRQEMKRAGLRQVFKNSRVADLAGMIVNSKAGIIYMAVGKTTARLILSWGSDNNPSPTWPNVRHDLLEDAHEIAELLRQPGCPVSLAKCH